MSGPPRGRQRARVVVGGVELEIVSDGAPRSLDALGLSPAEHAVARLVVEGASNEEIARRRGTSTRTVEKQVARCLHRLGARSRAELIARLERA